MVPIYQLTIAISFTLKKEMISTYQRLAVGDMSEVRIVGVDDGFYHSQKVTSLGIVLTGLCLVLGCRSSLGLEVFNKLSRAVYYKLALGYVSQSEE